eukprot:4604751-Prymnesium_polylepis.1
MPVEVGVLKVHVREVVEELAVRVPEEGARVLREEFIRRLHVEDDRVRDPVRGSSGVPLLRCPCMLWSAPL